MKPLRQFDETRIDSYTAASAFPHKLLHVNAVKNGKIKPLHIQLMPTNACNLNCTFCSCSDRDKKKKLTFNQILKILDFFSSKGTKAVTITGGGEPLLHKKLNEIIDYCSKLGLKVGLVTNGILLNKLKSHDNLTWCRISSSDDRVPSYDKIKEALITNPKTDWAFSHVVTKKPNYGIIKGLINFANKNKFTHVRLVSDLCDLENVPSMEKVKEKLKRSKDDKVIYQGRKKYTKGVENCCISLLKPVICPEGIFPCCGTQYAIYGQSRDMINKMRMGSLKDLEKIFNNQKYFDGSICDVCYYKQYNDALQKLLSKPYHLEFV